MIIISEMMKNPQTCHTQDELQWTWINFTEPYIVKQFVLHLTR